MIAMRGKNCVAIATDTRLSTQLMTIDSNFQRVFKVNDMCLMGVSGLGTDCQTLQVPIQCINLIIQQLADEIQD